MVVAARTGLGTINHTLLTVEAARAAGLERGRDRHDPVAREAGRIELSNRATVERLAGVPVTGLAPVAAGLAGRGRVRRCRLTNGLQPVGQRRRLELDPSSQALAPDPRT